MPKICGEFKSSIRPKGGGVHVSDTTYTNLYSDGTTDQTTKRSSYKSRMVFPQIAIGESSLADAFVAGDPLGHQIADCMEELDKGVRVCLYHYGHLLRKRVIIGLTTETGQNFLMPARGLVAGMFWYAVFSPIIVAIPAARHLLRPAVRCPVCCRYFLVQRPALVPRVPGNA
jgi:hypothetical protein